MSERFGIDENIKAVDFVLERKWITLEYEENPFAKEFRVHGYGIEIITNDINIDFDYSHEGNIDGFDAWRLYLHMVNGDPQEWDKNGTIKNAVYQWFNELEISGKITRKDN